MVVATAAVARKAGVVARRRTHVVGWMIRVIGVAAPAGAAIAATPVAVMALDVAPIATAVPKGLAVAAAEPVAVASVVGSAQVDVRPQNPASVLAAGR